MKPQYQVVLLAGGFAPWLQPLAGTDIRCQAKVNERSLLEYIVTALEQSQRVKSILLVAPARALAALAPELPSHIRTCEAGDTLTTTAEKALNTLHVPDQERVLFVCDDIPLLTPAAVEDFLSNCEQHPDKEAFYPIIARKDCQKQFPHVKRTYVQLADGTFTGGNMMLLSAGMVRGSLAIGKKIFSLRKSPFKLCSLIGWGFVLKLLLHLLSTQQAQERVNLLLGFPCQVIITPYAEIGVDVDKPSDWELVNRYLTK